MSLKFQIRADEMANALLDKIDFEVGAASVRLALLLITLLLLIWSTVWITTVGLRWIVPRAAGLRDRLVHLAQLHHTRLARITLALLDPGRQGSRALLTGLVLLLGSMWLFLGLVEDIVSIDPLVAADHAVFTLLQQMRTEFADRVMVGITEMGSIGVMLPLTVAVLAWLLWRRAWRTAGYWLGVVASAELIVQGLKITLGRQRPLPLYEGIEQFSFPSGHTGVSIVVLGFLAFLVTRGQSARWRLAVALTVAVYVVLVAFSRMYLGAHWLSDVLGAISFGLAWVSFVAMVYTHCDVREAFAPQRMAVMATVTIAIASALWITWRAPADLRRYSVRLEPQIMSEQAWLDGGWRALPQRRRELAGKEQERLPLQWVCEGQPLIQALVTAGWQPAPPLSLKAILLALAPNSSLRDLPVLPRLDGGRLSSLNLARQGSNPKAREVLRFWRSSIVVASGGASRVPLWYGAGALQQRSGPLDLWVRETPLDGRAMAGELAHEGTVHVAKPASADGGLDGPELLSCSHPERPG